MTAEAGHDRSANTERLELPAQALLRRALVHPGEAEESRRRSSPIRRALAFVAMAGPLLLATGCGGSSAAPPVASLTTTTAATTSAGASSPATKPSHAAFASCLASHGFPSSGSASGGITIFGVQIGNVDPGSPQLQAALQACRKLLPGGGPPQLTPAQQAEHAKALALFAACMRKNGVSNFPDPNGQGHLPFDGLKELDPSSTRFETAYKACRSLLPTFGPQIRFG